MRIIDAIWEKRNLGLVTQEIEIENDDSPEKVEKALKESDADYQVVKAPVARLDLYSLLTEYGFFFAEASIRVSHNLKNVACPEMIQRMVDRISFSEMSEEETDIMIENIRQGMFQTDRVILDPFFTRKQAYDRYILWMKDEKERGAKLFTYKYKEEPIGFSCMKETKTGCFYPVLGGVYNMGKALPLGSAIVYKQLDIAKSLGGKMLYTFISSNNPAVVRVYSGAGYGIDSIKNVFVKHTCEMKE
ncbi:MAG: GNAT family N-acetyltransferase [Lachnospiraceae bacterium]|nr:GNAT family N-acetyltransferase [Lachnospiraceae bacterium]